MKGKTWESRERGDRREPTELIQFQGHDTRSMDPPFENPRSRYLPDMRSRPKTGRMLEHAALRVMYPGPPSPKSRLADPTTIPLAAFRLGPSPRSVHVSASLYYHRDCLSSFVSSDDIRISPANDVSLPVDHSIPHGKFLILLNL